MGDNAGPPEGALRDQRAQAAAGEADRRPLYERYELEEFAGHLIRRAEQLHGQLWNELVPGGLTSPQWGVLHSLARHPGVDQTRLSELASLDRSTTADIARRLEARQLIRRRRDPADTRRYILEITAAGRAVMDTATPPALEVNARLVQNLSVQETRTLVRLLRLVVAAPPGQEAPREAPDPR